MRFAQRVLFIHRSTASRSRSRGLDEHVIFILTFRHRDWQTTAEDCARSIFKKSRADPRERDTRRNPRRKRIRHRPSPRIAPPAGRAVTSRAVHDPTDRLRRLIKTRALGRFRTLAYGPGTRALIYSRRFHTRRTPYDID